MSEKIGQNMMAEMLELGRQELIAANSGQPIEAPPVEAPQAASPSMDAVLANYAAEAPAPVMSQDLER